jgi:uncharacterized damage-inducible protein DinB
MKNSQSIDRRNFLKSSAGITAGALTLSSISSLAFPAAEESIYVIGPRQGYSLQVGTLVSMMNLMRMIILLPVKDMTIEQLDYIHDANSNSIGSMLLHLAATERFYQLNTFEKKEWGDKDKQRFEVAMNLGDEARKSIKGHPLDFYLNTLQEVRENTLAEFKKRDDNWLMEVDKDWGWGPTNNYCKWFHVCEHESNHNGQIKWIKGRIPGTKAAKE